jgi:hypothetical protein
MSGAGGNMVAKIARVEVGHGSDAGRAQRSAQAVPRDRAALAPTRERFFAAARNQRNCEFAAANRLATVEATFCWIICDKPVIPMLAVITCWIT